LLKLFIANKNYSSWSLRPWVLLKEVEIPFEECLVPFGVSAGHAGFKSFSPTGRLPCLVDGELLVWDSLAIVEYLAESYPSVWPRDLQARAWARCASAEMHSEFHHIRNICTMNCGLRVRISTLTPELQAEWQRVDELWVQGLSRFGGPFLVGSSFTAADAFFAPLAFRVQTYTPTLSHASSGYAKKLLDLPSMQSWYTSAIAETWRDEAHEAEARAAGTWLEDHRVSAHRAA